MYNLSRVNRAIAKVLVVGLCLGTSLLCLAMDDYRNVMLAIFARNNHGRDMQHREWTSLHKAVCTEDVTTARILIDQGVVS